MKHLLLSLFLIPVLCQAQEKKDSKIIVTVKDTTNLFNRLAGVFYKQEYTLDNKDQSAGFISTKEKSIKSSYPVDVKMRALIEGNTVTITGEVRLNVSVMNQPPSYDQIKFWGFKKSVARSAWEEMQKIADKLDGQISYSK